MPALKLPAGHGEHDRFEVAEPGCTMKLPGEHWVRATQAVLGLPSSSQVSPAQGTAGAVPPAQYWPATQDVHTVVDEVLETVCTVPA